MFDRLPPALSAWLSRPDVIALCAWPDRAVVWTPDGVQQVSLHIPSGAWGRCMSWLRQEGLSGWRVQVGRDGRDGWLRFEHLAPVPGKTWSDWGLAEAFRTGRSGLVVAPRPWAAERAADGILALWNVRGWVDRVQAGQVARVEEKARGPGLEGVVVARPAPEDWGPLLTGDWTVAAAVVGMAPGGAWSATLGRVAASGLGMPTARALVEGKLSWVVAVDEAGQPVSRWDRGAEGFVQDWERPAGGPASRPASPSPTPPSRPAGDPESPQVLDDARSPWGGPMERTRVEPLEDWEDPEEEGEAAEDAGERGASASGSSSAFEALGSDGTDGEPLAAAFPDEATGSEDLSGQGDEALELGSGGNAGKPGPERPDGPVTQGRMPPPRLRSITAIGFKSPSESPPRAPSSEAAEEIRGVLAGPARTAGIRVQVPDDEPHDDPQPSIPTDLGPALQGRDPSSGLGSAQVDLTEGTPGWLDAEALMSRSMIARVRRDEFASEDATAAALSSGTEEGGLDDAESEQTTHGSMAVEDASGFVEEHTPAGPLSDPPKGHS